MSKAEKMFEQLGLSMKHIQHIENDKVIKNVIEFSRIDYTKHSVARTIVTFDLLNKCLTSLNEHGINEINLTITAYEKLKELGWTNE